MTWKNVKLILLRELRDQLRDRRTLFMVAVLPLIATWFQVPSAAMPMSASLSGRTLPLGANVRPLKVPLKLLDDGIAASQVHLASASPQVNTSL